MRTDVFVLLGLPIGGGVRSSVKQYTIAPISIIMGITMADDIINFEDLPDFARMIKLYARVGDESERGMVVLMAAELDRVISNLLKCYIPPGTARDYLFSGQSPVLSSFSSKINLARALELITEDEFKDLHSIRNIRNLFAHNPDVSFETPAIINRVLKFTKTYTNYTARGRFEMRGVDLITEIEFDASRKACERVREEAFNTYFKRGPAWVDANFETAEAVAVAHGAVVSWE